MDKQKRNRAIILALLGIVGCIILFVFPQRKPQWREANGVIWATTYSIKYLHTDDLADSIMSVFKSVDLSVSPFNKNSIVTAINENRSDSVDAIFSTVFAKSAVIFKETGGAFDPTLSPLINAWGFGYKEGSVPSESQVDSILQFVGFDKVHLDKGKIQKADSRMSFNFSAIAKGFACDEIGRMFKRNGITDFLIEVGGEVVVSGKNSKGEEWRLSIDAPVESQDAVSHQSMKVIAVSDCGVATSGNYRNYQTDSVGAHYGHIIDPATGYPGKTDILSATVIAADCMVADAYATAFMVLGKSKSLEFLKRRDDIAALFVVGSAGTFEIVHTANFPGFGK